MAEQRGFFSGLPLVGGMFRRTRVAPTQTAGAPGTAVWGGYPEEHEREASLQGAEKWRTFSDLLANVSIVAASVRYFLNLVAKPEWKVEPAEDGGGEAERIAELVQEVMEGTTTPWHRIVRRSAMYKFHGFSVQEWTARRRKDGFIMFSDIEPRPQATITRWDTERGKVFGMTQTDPQTGHELYLHRGKVIYLVDDTISDSPLGLGLLRHLAEPANRLQRFQLLEAFGHETDLRGIPVGRAPLAELQRLVEDGKLSKEEKEQAEASLREFIKQHIRNPKLGLLLDSKTYTTGDDKETPSTVYQWDMDLLRGATTGGPQEAAAKSIERVTREMARVMGTEFLMLGGDGKGSLALSRDKTDMFVMLIDSALVEIRETYEHDFLDPLFTLNGWNEDLRPQLKTESIQFRDVEKMAATLRDLAESGAPLIPEDPAVGEVYDMLGLTRPDMELREGLDDEDETTTQPGAGTVPIDGDPDEVPESRSEEPTEEGQ